MEERCAMTGITFLLARPGGSISKEPMRAETSLLAFKEPL